MADQDGSGFLWFLAGLGLGSLAGVLYAPKAGHELRQDLKSKAAEGGDYVRSRARDAAGQASDFVDKSKGVASDWVDKGKDAVGQQKDQFRAAYEAGRQAYQEATSDPTATKI